MKDPVSNITRTDLVNTRQRQNVSRTRIWGVQTDVEYRLQSDWRVNAGYMFNQAKFKEYDENPALVGNYLPQVPQHRGSVTITYSNPRFVSASVSGLFFSSQFEDDQNILARPGNFAPGLPAYAVVELMVTRALGRHADIFFGVQNLFDEEYYVFLPPTTLGSPRLANGGVRVRFSGR
jgi:outer membrane receptor protein involved in Fe transport